MSKTSSEQTKNHENPTKTVNQKNQYEIKMTDKTLSSQLTKRIDATALRFEGERIGMKPQTKP